MAKKSRKKAAGSGQASPATPKASSSEAHGSDQLDPKETPAEASDAEASDAEASDAQASDAEASDASEADGSKDGSASGAAAARASTSGGGGSDDEQPQAPKPAAWGRPLMRLDGWLTKFEIRLVVFTLVLQVVAICFWVFLSSMSKAPPTGEFEVSIAGLVFRGALGAVVLGMLGFWGLKKQSLKVRRIAAISGAAIGVIVAPHWLGWGVPYFSNLLNWYGQASTLTLLGGLRGVITRLTLLLAMLGGSLATGAGKHITIDVVTRLVKPVVRKWMVLVGWIGTAAICFSASWGFYDHITIEAFGARNDDTASVKISKTFDSLGEKFFILRKQIGLDFKTLPHVIKGEGYANCLTGKEWNEWLDSSGMAERYGQAEVDAIKMPPDSTRSPFITVPGKGSPSGELISSANLVVPIGLFIIGLRFILLTLLVLSGHRTTEPQEDHAFDSDDSGAPPPPDPDPPKDSSEDDASQDDASEDDTSDDDTSDDAEKQAEDSSSKREAA